MRTMVPRSQVASALGVSRQTLWEWARDGKGPTAYRIGGGVRYFEDEVAQWLKDQMIHPDDGGKPEAAQLVA